MILQKNWKDELKKININILFQSTDGDRGASQMHEDFFSEMFLSKGKIIFPDFKEF